MKASEPIAADDSPTQLDESQAPFCIFEEFGLPRPLEVANLKDVMADLDRDLGIPATPAAAAAPASSSEGAVTSDAYVEVIEDTPASSSKGPAAGAAKMQDFGVGDFNASVDTDKMHALLEMIKIKLASKKLMLAKE